MNNSIKEILIEAESLTLVGAFDKALEKYIWVFDNALSVDSSMVGVRLSYCLHGWRELGEKYPPAFDALCERSNRIQSELMVILSFPEKEFNHHDFHDYVSINELIDRNNLTIEMFKIFDNADISVTNVFFIFAKKILLKNQEYSLYFKYIGDLNLFSTTWKDKIYFIFEHINKNENSGLEKAFPYMIEDINHIIKVYRQLGKCEDLNEFVLDIVAFLKLNSHDDLASEIDFI